VLDRVPIDCIGQQLPQIKFSLSGQWYKWGVSSPQINGATAEAVREEGVISREIVLISIFAQGSMKHFCCSPITVLKEKHQCTQQL